MPVIISYIYIEKSLDESVSYFTTKYVIYIFYIWIVKRSGKETQLTYPIRVSNDDISIPIFRPDAYFIARNQSALIFEEIILVSVNLLGIFYRSRTRL